jgi:sigma-B regulation protein RsbU (phosphoserine phosphatase)
LAAGLAAQAASAFEGCWRRRESLERQRIDKELALAASIQQGLFPAELPSLAGFELAAFNRPARHVGGDYYDVLPEASGAWLLCVADVSGKGVGASLLMGTIQATVRALCGAGTPLAEFARRINDLLYVSTPANKYVTAIMMELDPATGACRYVSGGHPDGLILRASGHVEWLQATGLALGLFPGMTYETRAAALAPGDVAVLYSDGVPEAQNPAEDQFGAERLAAALSDARREPARVIVERVMADIDGFTQGAPPHDDITILVAKRSAGV